MEEKNNSEELNISEKLNEIKDSLNNSLETKSIELNDKVESFETKSNDLETKNGELAENIKSLETKVSMLEKRNTSVKMENNNEVKSFKELVYEGLQSKNMNSNFIDLEIKASTMDSNYTGNRALASGVIHGPKVDTFRFRELFANYSTSDGSVPYLTETNGFVAGVQVEGSAKQDNDVTIVQNDALVRDVAGVITVSRQMMMDIARISNYINDRLGKAVVTEENSQLIYGSGTGSNLVGISGGALKAADIAYRTSTPTEVDCVLGGIQALSGLNHTPNFVVLNSADYVKIIGLKETTGQYLQGIVYEGGNLFIHGILVKVSNDVVAGDLVMGDVSAMDIYNREGFNIRMSESNNDNFDKNMVSVRGEERITNTILYPQGFVVDSFANLKVAIGS